MVERKLSKTTNTYVQEIRKILAHYCNCLSNVIFEWVGIKTAYTRVREKEFTMKALDTQINQSSKNLETIILGFEQFLKSYDKGKRIKDLMKNYFQLK